MFFRFLKEDFTIKYGRNRMKMKETVWHEAEEIPETNRMIIFNDCNTAIVGKFCCLYFKYNNKWLIEIIDGNIYINPCRWAYWEDLNKVWVKIKES